MDTDIFWYAVLKTRQQAPNRAAKAKPHITKLRLDLIIASALPEVES